MPDPVRKRFYGDTDMAQSYTRDALNLLDYVKGQMGFNSLRQLSKQVILASGIILFAASVFGQDEIRVFAPSGGGQPSTELREYCVWGPDAELYSDLIPALGTRGAGMDSDKTIVYVGDATSRNIYSVDAATLRNQSHFDGSGGLILPSMGRMFADTKTNHFGVYLSDDFDTGDTFIQSWTVGATGTSGFDTAVGLNSAIPLTAMPQDFGATNGGLYTLTGGDYSTPGNNFWWILDAGTHAVVREITNPAFLYAPAGVETEALVGDGGDVLFVSVPAYAGNSTITHYGLKSGADSSYAGPPTLLADAHSGTAFGWAGALQNDNATLWMRVADMNTPGQDSLYTRSQGLWTAVTVQGGFGSFGAFTASTTIGVMHDDISDAVAVVMGDLSGVWIFNSRDCMNVGNEPFFFAFKSAPTSQLDKNGTVYKGIIMGTFHDATLILGYQTATGTIVGRYDIGRLKQTKMQEETVQPSP